MTRLFNRVCTVAMICLTLPAHALEVSFEKDPSLPLVQLNIAIKAGAVADPENALGLTNFMGEMLLRGTKKKTKEQIDGELDQLGAQIGVETRSEAMIIRGAVLRTKLIPFLSLLQELLTEPNFPEKEIQKLKSQVVSQILEDEGSDQKLAGLNFSKFLFGNHPYGKPILGKTMFVEKVTRDQLVQHYHDLFTHDLLLVLGSGDAEVADISAWANRLTQNLPKTGRDFSRIQPPKNPSHRRLMIVDKPKRTQTQITAGQVGIQMTDPAFFALYLGNHAFGGGSFSARLMKQIRVERGWSYGASSYFKYSRSPRSWQFYLFPASKDTPAALEYTLKMVEVLYKNGITQEEFDFAQRSLVNGAGFMYNTSKKRMENKLAEKTLGLPEGFMKTYGQKLAQVTLQDTNQALHSFLKPDQLSIVVLATARELKDALAHAAGVNPSEVIVVPYSQE